jgi:peptide/nickel transport system substrate-binding protein
MNNWDELQKAARTGKLTRREFLGRAAALGVTTSLASGAMATMSFAADAPKKGGTLRLGLAGGSTTDSMDVRTYTDSFMMNVGAAIMNATIEIDPDNNPIPSLFESWDTKPGAAEWVFKVKQGVTFHNGKTLDADDIVYSFNLHRGKDTKSSAAVYLAGVDDIKATDKHEVTFTLKEGDADLLYSLSDYHFLVVPKDFNDWSKPIGTGAFKYDAYEPGVSARVVRNENYWNPGRGNVDVAEYTCINDTAARMNALVAGQVDLIHRVDTSTIDLIKAVPNLQLIQKAGGYHAIYAMRCDMPPFDNADLRRAVKYAVDRDQLLKALFNGYGVIGNDTQIPPTDPFYNTELEQYKYDPDKAKFYLKKSGVTKITAPLSASDAAFNGAVDAALLFQANAKAAGVDFPLKKEPADGFWDNVWLKVPFCESYWGGRPCATMMMTVAMASTAAWNETGWKVPAFDKLLSDAKKEIDHEKRKQMIWELQRMTHDDGGAVVPAFKSWVDAADKKVKNYQPYSLYDLCNTRVAEMVWIDEA